LTARPRVARNDETRPHAEVFRRFFSLIERLERPLNAAHPPAPEVKARISRLDQPPRRHG
jgi:hypothetical protein